MSARLDAQIIEALSTSGGRPGLDLWADVNILRKQEARWWRRWPVSLGAIYVATARMEREGRILSRWGEPTAERGMRRPKYFWLVAPTAGLRKVSENP